MEYANQLIVIILLALVAGVALRWVWNIRRRRRGTLKLQIEDVPERDDDFELLRGELPNGGARIVPKVGMERPIAPVVGQSETSDQRKTTHVENAPTAEDAVVGERPVMVAEDVEAIGSDVSAVQSSAQSSALPAVPTPSSDSIPTAASAPAPVSAATPESGAAPVQPTLDLPIPPVENAAEEGAATESKRRDPKRDRRTEWNDAESPIIIWVIARGDGFHGSGLLDVFSRNGLKYNQKSQVFTRLGDDGDEQYLVANGVDPGTFDLVDMERKLVTPRVVLLLQPSTVDNPLPAFEDFCHIARDIAASLGGDLQDDARGAMSEQTIEHYRQRVLELTRRRMSRPVDDS